MEIKLSSKKVLADDIIIPLEIDDPNAAQSMISIPLVIKNIALDIQSPGELNIHYKAAKERWKLARSLNIEHSR